MEAKDASWAFIIKNEIVGLNLVRKHDYYTTADRLSLILTLIDK